MVKFASNFLMKIVSTQKVWDVDVKLIIAIYNYSYFLIISSVFDC